MTVGERIKALRKAKGWTRTKLAQKAGISQSMMSYYERDKVEMSFFKAMCISTALGVSLEYLAGREKE